MRDIVLSQGVRGNLLALQSTSNLMARTQTRLATGKKVNSALDNPTNFFTSEALNSRAGDLGSLLDSVSNAIKTLEAADNGIKSIKQLVESTRASARQALQNGGTTARLMGNNTTALTSTSVLQDLVAGVNDFVVGSTITITTGTNRSTSLTITATTTVQDLIRAINDNTSMAPGSPVDNVDGTVAVGTAAGADARASLSADGKLVLEAINGTSTIQLSFDRNTNGDTVGAFRQAVAALGIDQTGGTYTEGTAGTDALYTTATTAAGPLSTARSTFAAQCNELLNQIDKLAQDAGFNGINLLYGGSLKVLFNEQSTSFLTIAGVTFTSAGLGITAAGNNFQTDYDINAALTQIQTSLVTLQSQASTLGSNLSVVQTRQDFIRMMINTLRTGADNLTLADTNEEGANMLALQTRQQLSQTALSLAAQADQNVLRLFA
jgi:flagellin